MGLVRHQKNGIRNRAYEKIAREMKILKNEEIFYLFHNAWADDLALLNFRPVGKVVLLLFCNTPG